MSERHRIQDASGVVFDKPPLGDGLTVLAVAPTNGQKGYITGALWVNTAGTAGAILYINQGSNTSTTWVAIA